MQLHVIKLRPVYHSAQVFLKKPGAPYASYTGYQLGVVGKAQTQAVFQKWQQVVDVKEE